MLKIALFESGLSSTAARRNAAKTIFRIGGTP
jgi:hypothetical protein